MDIWCLQQDINKKGSISWNHSDHLVHHRCAYMSLKHYTNTWTCILHTQPTHTSPTHTHHPCNEHAHNPQTPNQHTHTQHTRTTYTHVMHWTYHTTLNHNSSSCQQGQIVILQIIRNKIEELKLLTKNVEPDILTIQETKLMETSRTPNILQYTTIRTDRQHKHNCKQVIWMHTQHSSIHTDDHTTTTIIHRHNSNISGTT